MRKAATGLVTVFALSFAVFTLFGCVQSFFFYPDSKFYGSPRDAGLKYEQVGFFSADHTRLTGWMIPAAGLADPRQAKGTVIHFHGNAQNMTAHWEYAGWLARRGFNVFVFDYRGYGMSAGSPEMLGLNADAVAAIRYVHARADIDAARLLIFGQSLGGNLAIAAVGRAQNAELRAGIRAVAIESTFISYSKIAGEKVRIAGAFLTDEYSAERNIARIAPIPLLLIHGTADEVIPFTHGVRLFALAKEPKTFITVPGGAHIEAMTPRFGNTYRDLLVKFYEDALAAPPPALPPPVSPSTAP
ncbi:MAG TPA: alpha/beta hydrolase [Burkholderiales bacterium]|jgi:hypothetical protein